MQILKFRDKAGYRVKWDSSVSLEHQPATAHYHCVHCQHPFTELERWHAANSQVEWRPHNPTAKGVAGFWINHLYVPFTWKTTADITRAFLKAKGDRQSLKTFINTTLAEEWQDEGEVPDKDKLFARREGYPFNDEAVVPMRGLFLTAAVDVQDSPPRLEVEVKAWGRGRENWSVGYWILQAFGESGDPLSASDPRLWEQLDELLMRDWDHASGHTIPILCMTIDTGKLPKPVYEYARRHSQLFYGPSGIRRTSIRTVVPVKGTPDDIRIISSISKEDAARKRQGTRIVGIGTHCAKGEIFDLLRNVAPKGEWPTDTPTPGCYHFPMYDMVYFEGLTAEVKVVKANGDVDYEKRGPRNEPVDLAVYNRGAAAIVGIDRFGEAQWRQLEEALRPMTVTGEEVVEAEAEAEVSPPPSPAIPTAPITAQPNVSAAATRSAPTVPITPAQQYPQRRIRGSFL